MTIQSSAATDRLPGVREHPRHRSSPAGAITALAVTLGYGLARMHDHAAGEARTAATIVFLMTSLWVLAIQARPLRGWKPALVGGMGALSALAFVVPVARRFYELQLPPVGTVVQVVMLGAVAAAGIEAVSRLGATGTRRPRPGQAPSAGK
jgi:cation-transporting P-type ATPase E